MTSSLALLRPAALSTTSVAGLFHRIARSIAIVAIASHGAVVLAADAPAAAADKQACTPVPGFGDILQVDCRWTPAAAPQTLAFKATFGGSHDDTIVKIEPSLNGKPLACDTGSKTRADFEDGEVTLQCLFTVAPSAGPQVLGVKVVWSHAQYMDFDFGTAR